MPTPRKVILNCPLSADIVVVSSEGHLFSMRWNLGKFNGGFPLEITLNGEDVPMPDLDSESLSLFLESRMELSNLPSH